MAGAILAAAAGCLVRLWRPVRAAVDQLRPRWGVKTSVPAALSPGTATGGPVHIVAEHLAYFTGPWRGHRLPGRRRALAAWP